VTLLEQILRATKYDTSSYALATLLGKIPLVTKFGKSLTARSCLVTFAKAALPWEGSSAGGVVGSARWRCTFCPIPFGAVAVAGLLVDVCLSHCCATIVADFSLAKLACEEQAHRLGEACHVASRRQVGPTYYHQGSRLQAARSSSYRRWGSE